MAITEEIRRRRRNGTKCGGMPPIIEPSAALVARDEICEGEIITAESQRGTPRRGSLFRMAQLDLSFLRLSL
jgi:hypothetical protein